MGKRVNESPDSYNTRMREWRANHRKQTSIYNRRYRQLHHEKLIQCDRQRYAGRKKSLIRGARRRHLQNKYGLTEKDYNQLVQQQKGLCALCRRTYKGLLFVDHDHATGRVRGLLCYGCNSALARLGDSEENLQRVLTYLQGNRP